MSEKYCADCGDENVAIKFKDRFYCKCCANFLMEKLKLQYYAGMKKLGREIQDLVEQLHEPTDLWTGNAESFLEADEIRSYQYENMALYCSPDAQTMLRAFVREKLDGDINNFKDFDFETLKNDDFFGCVNPQNFDCDNTCIIRAVYVLLWSKVFPDMTDWREIGTGKCCRGDTIHTFHTIFGRPDPEKPGHFFGIDRFAPINDTLYERIRKFHEKICTLGNFVVLPNFTVKSWKGFVTLNTYRGTNHWYDYFDQFLLALEPCLVNGCNADKTLYELVHKCNGYAFENYKNQEGFTRMAKALLLDDYLDENGHAKNLFADAGGKVRFHWENPQPPRKLYLQSATNYLDHAEKIISNRSDRMIEMLKEFC